MDTLKGKTNKRTRFFVCTSYHVPEQNPPPNILPDIVLDDFESGSFDRWKKEGTAFGEAPIEVPILEKVTGRLDAQGNRVANSYNLLVIRPGENADDLTGRLVREPFIIERRYLTFSSAEATTPVRWA